MSRRGLPPEADDAGEDEQEPEREWKEEYTLAKVRNTRPLVIEQAGELLARGIPKMHIAKALGMHFYTLCEIERQCFPEIEQQRQNVAQKAYSALTASLDSALDRAHKGLATAMDSKMLADAWRDLTQQAGAPINVVHHFPALEEFERLGGDEGKVIEQAD